MTRLRDRSGALIAAGLIAGLVVWPGCSRKRGVEIYQDGEVTVVHNPETPCPAPGGPSQLILREDLVIGRSTDPSGYVFGVLDSLGVDDEENIWVLDRRPIGIRTFTKDGSLLRSFGRNGNGPGELERPSGLFVRGDGALAVLDLYARKAVFYDREGRYLRAASTTTPPHLGIKIDSRGNIFGVSFKKRALKLWSNKLFRYDAEMAPLAEIAGFEQPSAPEIIHAFERYLYFHLTKDDRIIWLITSNYEFRVLDPEGREVRRIIKEYRPVRIAPEARKALTEELTGGEPVPPGMSISIPAFYPPVDRFIADEDGRLFVRTYERDGRGGVWFDAFDPDGRFVTRFLFPESERAVAVRKGRLYAIVDEDESGVPLIKRYALDWK
jgi:hypothetical protein